MQVIVLDFRPVERNSLLGFLSLLLPDAGLVVHDVAIHQRDGRAWITLPGRLMTGRDGLPMRDGFGKPQFAPIITFVSRGCQDAFNDAVLAALRLRHPEALREGGR